MARARVLDEVIARAPGDGLVVVAAHGDRPLRHQVPHLLHHPRRVRPVAHEVAEEGQSVSTVQVGLFETGFEGFAVGVDVGDEGEFMGDPESS